MLKKLAIVLPIGVPVAAGASSLLRQQAARGEPITIGVLHSLSGSMATSEAPVVDGTLLAVYPVQYEGLEDSPKIVYTGAAPRVEA